MDFSKCRRDKNGFTGDDQYLKWPHDGSLWAVFALLGNDGGI